MDQNQYKIRRAILLEMGGKDFYRAYLKFNNCENMIEYDEIDEKGEMDLWKDSLSNIQKSKTKTV